MSVRQFRPLRATLVVAALAAVPCALHAQSGADLIRRMQAKQAERLSRIDNLTVTHDAMGMTVTSYMEKRDVAGVVSLVPVSTTSDGPPSPIPSADDLLRNNPAQMLSASWADRFSDVGRGEVDGHAVTVLELTDFDGMPQLRGRGEGRPNVDSRMVSMRFSLDETDLIMRAGEMKVEVRMGGGPDTMTVRMALEDYRDVEGYLLPYRTRMTTEGMPGLEPENVEGQLQMMKNLLDRMPAAQRGMIEKTIKQLEARLANGGETVMTVTDVKVNAGPPNG